MTVAIFTPPQYGRRGKPKRNPRRGHHDLENMTRGINARELLARIHRPGGDAPAEHSIERWQHRRPAPWWRTWRGWGRLLIEGLSGGLSIVLAFALTFALLAPTFTVPGGS